MVGKQRHGYWTDLDLDNFRYTVRGHDGWKPKDGDDRVIELTDDLVPRLRARRDRTPTAMRNGKPTATLIFPGAKGKANLDILKIIKELAWKSNVNCGACHSKAKKVCKKHPECATGRSCLHHPVCFKVIAHKTRKRFATKMAMGGVDTETIMQEAGWASYATMKNYLADMPNPGLRAQKNRAFACRLAAPFFRGSPLGRL